MAIPFIAKYYRNCTGFYGKGLEIAALVLGFWGCDNVLIYAFQIEYGIDFIVLVCLCVLYAKSFNNITPQSPATAKSTAPQHKEVPPKITQAPTSKPTEQHPQKSAPTASASNPYKKAYIIALIVAGCLFLACSVLGLRYYYDTMELNQTIADYQENIQQLETDLQTAQDDLKYKDQHIQIVRNSVKSQRILSYNDGFEDGYIQGYNDAVETKAKYPVLLPDIDEYLLPYHFE